MVILSLSLFLIRLDFDIGWLHDRVATHSNRWVVSLASCKVTKFECIGFMEMPLKIC